MENKYAKLETMNDSIKNSINCLKPEIIEMLQNEYGNLDTYIKIFEGKDDEEKNDIKQLIKYFEILDWREQKAMMLRYGLLDRKRRTLEEVAQIMETSEGRIRRIEGRAFTRRCDFGKNRKLREFLSE